MSFTCVCVHKIQKVENGHKRTGMYKLMNKCRRHVEYINDSELVWTGLELHMAQKGKWHINDDKK